MCRGLKLGLKPRSNPHTLRRYAFDDALPLPCLLNCNSFPTLRSSASLPRFPLGGLPSAVSGEGQRAQMRWGGRVRSEAAKQLVRARLNLDHY
jgi:hypothetical protein